MKERFRASRFAFEEDREPRPRLAVDDERDVEPAATILAGLADADDHTMLGSSVEGFDDVLGTAAATAAASVCSVGEGDDILS